MLAPLVHEPTRCAVTAERALLRRLEGGCQIPIGALGTVDGDTLQLQAVIGSLDGTKIVRGSRGGSFSAAEELGIGLAEERVNITLKLGFRSRIESAGYGRLADIPALGFFFPFFLISIFGVFPTLLWPRVAVEAAVAVR